MHGCFIGTTREGVTGVLVMSDCGHALPGMLERHSRDIRIHQAGVEHGDFAEWNLVVSKAADGEYCIRVVEFGNAREHPGCPITLETLEMCSLRPFRTSDFSCTELWCACEDAGVWLPSYVSWFHTRVPIKSIRDAATLVDLNIHPNDYTRDEALRRAAIAITEVQKKWNTRIAWDEDPVVIDL
ncbi:hypothetical protein C8T65DRAFT_694052 [Cerioporus squamosus]|nr:hypothetical protein C8T65DRAFT_694052 [Cerioporus squamosus]